MWTTVCTLFNRSMYSAQRYSKSVPFHTCICIQTSTHTHSLSLYIYIYITHTLSFVWLCVFHFMFLSSTRHKCLIRTYYLDNLLLYHLISYGSISYIHSFIHSLISEQSYVWCDILAMASYLPS